MCVMCMCPHILANNWVRLPAVRGSLYSLRKHKNICRERIFAEKKVRKPSGPSEKEGEARGKWGEKDNCWTQNTLGLEL